ncbi:MAG: Maf family nucleotide pyrophosphatase [Pseudomonadota bacterium]
MGNEPKLILASASPRRLQLLKQVCVTPDEVLPADLDERVLPHEKPRDYALRVAHEKVEMIAAKRTGALVLGADTAVACGRRILPKTENEDVARQCLSLLSGRAHRVYTAVVLAVPGQSYIFRIVETRVKVRHLNKADIDAYLLSGEWHGKAGGYGIQGQFAMHIIDMIGSYSNVVGLPLYETMNILRGAGYLAPETAIRD